MVGTWICSRTLRCCRWRSSGPWAALVTVKGLLNQAVSHVLLPGSMAIAGAEQASALRPSAWSSSRPALMAAERRTAWHGAGVRWCNWTTGWSLRGSSKRTFWTWRRCSRRCGASRAGPVITANSWSATPRWLRADGAGQPDGTVGVEVGGAGEVRHAEAEAGPPDVALQVVFSTGFSPRGLLHVAGAPHVGPASGGGADDRREGHCVQWRLRGGCDADAAGREGTGAPWGTRESRLRAAERN